MTASVITQDQRTNQGHAAQRSRSNSTAQGHASQRTRSTSLGQLPRSFEYGEDFLAKSAADAYKSNPAYAAIERDTLNAVAPFLELKRRERAGSRAADHSASPSPVQTKTYAYRHKDSAGSSIDLSFGSENAHNRGSSISSLSYEDFRNSVKTVPSVNVTDTPGSSPSNVLNRGSSRKLSFSIGSNSTGIPAYIGNPHSTLSPQSSATTQFCISPLQAQALGHAYGLDSPSPQQLEMIQTRLRSLSLGTQRARQSSIASVMSPAVLASGPPDAAFTLTRFVQESVRHHSPSSHEIDEKLRLRKDFEMILQAVQPTAQLVMFGSVENGLNLANADMDLMVVDHSPIDIQLHDLQVDLPSLYAEALRSQGYTVKLLAKTRIALIKVQREYIGGCFSCDICFDNPLALHNTRLLAAYAACDPRVPVLMMFIKLWARSRRINDSFGGTLKSYGFLLLLVYYLQNKCTPALLPNLQMISTSGRAVNSEDLICQGYDIWYSKDVDVVPSIQQNTNSIGELLEGFFSHFAYEFDYRDWVVSIRMPGGLQNKSAKGWTQLIEHLNENGSAKVKDRYILSIEDPFEITHNVARTVTRAGLYEIRGEFMAAVRAIRSNKLNELTTPNL